MDDTIPPERRPDADNASDTMPTFSTAEAAALLGVTTGTVRARLRRGALSGMKVGGVWRVQLPDDLSLELAIGQVQQEVTPEPAARREADGELQDATPVDLAPLAEVTTAQTRQTRELSAETAVWQTRALEAETQLKQILAGSGRVREADTPGDAVGRRRHRLVRVLRHVSIWSARCVLMGILLLVLVRWVNRRDSGR